MTATTTSADTLGLLDGDTRANLGGVYENAVAQQFACHGFKPYYFTSKKIGELDFVLEKADGTIIIIWDCPRLCIFRQPVGGSGGFYRTPRCFPFTLLHV